MKTHFHEQEASLLQTTRKKTFLTIAVTSILLAFAYTNAFALTSQDLQNCETIKVQYIKNEMIETDSIDEYTLNLKKDEAITTALYRANTEKPVSFFKHKGYCEISILLDK